MQNGIPRDADAMEVEAKEEAVERYNGASICRFPAGVEHPCGLRNLGNTCYMNTVVQALAHIRPLAAFLLSDIAAITSPGAGVTPSAKNKSAIARRRFSDGLANTMRILWSGKQRDYTCRALMEAVFDTIPEFRVHGQQDAEEALTYTLNNLHDDLFVPVPKDLHPAAHILANLESERKELDDIAEMHIAQRDAIDEAARLKRDLESRIAQAYEPYKRSIVSDTFLSLLAQRVKCARCESVSLTVQECFTVPLELPSRAQTKAQVTEQRGPYNGKGVKHVLSNSSLDPGPPKSPVQQEATVPQGFFSTAWQTFKNTFAGGHTLELEQCLRSFFSSETLKGEEQYYCDHCKTKEDAIKTHEFVHLPEILCFQLKRFNKNRGAFGLGSAKNSTVVRYPVEGLDLSPFCNPDACESSTMYDLISVIRHSGGANSGHYIATCKSPVQGKWYEYDDEFVSPILSHEALQSADAYLLFYARRPSEDDIQRRNRTLKLFHETESTPDSPRAYISRYWALKFETMADPGPVDNWAFTCEHGRIAMPVIKASKRITDRVVAVSTRALDELSKLYKGLYPAQPVLHLEACEICKEIFDALSARRLAEFEECKELESSGYSKVFFALPSSWLQRWLSFVYNDVGPLGRGDWFGVQPPGEINMQVLYDKDDKSVKPSLKMQTHYVMINQPLFRFWEKAYGVKGGPLARLTNDIYGQPATKEIIDAEMDIDVKARELATE